MLFLMIEADELSEYDDNSSDDNDSVLEEDDAEPQPKQRTWFPFYSTKNNKRENGEGIEQGSSLAVVVNQSKKNWSCKNFFFLVKREKPNLLSVKCESAILFSMERDQYPSTCFLPCLGR